MAGPNGPGSRAGPVEWVGSHFRLEVAGPHRTAGFLSAAGLAVVAAAVAAVFDAKPVVSEHQADFAGEGHWLGEVGEHRAEARAAGVVHYCFTTATRSSGEGV